MIAFARPHEVKIVHPAEGARGITAKVNRVLNTGSLARVELVGVKTRQARHPDYYEVELTPDELTALGLSAGQPVRLLASRLRLYERKSGGASP
jgi:sulfate transport system ATP-binding protein